MTLSTEAGHRRTAAGSFRAGREVCPAARAASRRTRVWDTNRAAEACGCHSRPSGALRRVCFRVPMHVPECTDVTSGGRLVQYRSASNHHGRTTDRPALNPKVLGSIPSGGTWCEARLWPGFFVVASRARRWSLPDRGSHSAPVEHVSRSRQFGSGGLAFDHSALVDCPDAFATLPAGCRSPAPHPRLRPRRDDLCPGRGTACVGSPVAHR